MTSQDRRPITSRQWPFFQRLANRLAQSGVSPNVISVSSVFFACGAGCSLAATSLVADEWLARVLWLASAVLIQMRLVADLLDGMVAIEGGAKSATGELYNEVPDRISDPAILIGAGFAEGGHSMLGMTAALVAMFVAYIRAVGVSVGVGQMFLGPMAKPARMALLTIACIYCAAAPRSWQPNPHDLGIVSAALGAIIVGGAITAVRRLNCIARLLKRDGESNS